MIDGAALALALGAGVVAALNPCGFALLPAYLSLLVLDEQPSRTVAVIRALRATAAMTAGFVAVFAVFGLVVAPAASSVQQYLPAFTVALGFVLALAGAWVLTGRGISVPRLGRRRTDRRPLTVSIVSMAGFGASYAVASLGCTIAPFLAVVVTAFRAGSTAEGLWAFFAYAVGMGVVVGAASVAVALTRSGVIGRLRSLGGALTRLGGALLLVAGAYVAWYGAWELRVFHAGAGSDPVVEAGGELQRELADTAQAVGAGGFLLALVVLVVVGTVLRARSAAKTSSGQDRNAKSQR